MTPLIKKDKEEQRLILPFFAQKLSNRSMATRKFFRLFDGLP